MLCDSIVLITISVCIGFHISIKHAIDIVTHRGIGALGLNQRQNESNIRVTEDI